MSIELTIICLLSIPIFVITSKYFGAKIKQIAYKIRKDTAKHMEILDEGLSLIVTNKLYDYYEEQQKNYKEKVDDLMKNSYSLFINSIYSKQIFGLTASIFPIIILIQGGYKVAANEISVGMIVAFISYLSYLYNPVTVLSKLNMVIKEMKVSIKRIDEILNMNKENLYEYDSKIEDQDIKGNIEFKNVGYDINNKTILKDVSFTIKSGELVAIVGTNGVGKSTLLNLLLRLYDFDGDILIDDISIKDMNTSSIRNLISIVPQRGSLYATSIRENIKIGKKDAKNDEIEQVLELVNLKSFIDSLEDGLDTEVFGNEVNLSGGEKQKILCARAFLKPSKILILDEALNAIDNESKEIIIKNILKMKEQKTIIMITHDPDNLKIVDKVIEIKSYN
jgi:ABC-type multidrug transport system fused ATPase/permease subunit